MKKIILGLIIGLIIATTLNVGAAIQEYILRPVTYPLIVDGEEYISDELPILTLRTKEGDNTYVPLRSMSDMLGVDISWNAEIGRVEVGNVVNDAEEKYISDDEETKQEESNLSQPSYEYEIYSKYGWDRILLYEGVEYIFIQDFNEKYKNIGQLENGHLYSYVFNIDTMLSKTYRVSTEWGIYKSERIKEAVPTKTFYHMFDGYVEDNIIPWVVSYEYYINKILPIINYH